MSKTAASFFNKEEERIIVEAIRQAELSTSGEIRVHLESRTGSRDAMQRAAYIFKRLKMHKTKDRNGVLFYFAVQDRVFAIIGDKGIDAAVPHDFWNTIKDELQQSFAAGEFCAPLARAIRKAGKQLQAFFPYAQDDINELPDEISYDE